MEKMPVLTALAVAILATSGRASIKLRKLLTISNIIYE